MTQHYSGNTPIHLGTPGFAALKQIQMEIHYHIQSLYSQTTTKKNSMTKPTRYSSTKTTGTKQSSVKTHTTPISALEEMRSTTTTSHLVQNPSQRANQSLNRQNHQRKVFRKTQPSTKKSDRSKHLLFRVQST